MLRRSACPALLALFALSCGSSTASESSTPPDSGQAAASVVDSGAEGGQVAALHTEVVEAAKGATDIEKMKLRMDDSGTLVKQAIYHGDKARIAEPVHALADKEFGDAQRLHYENEWYAEHGAVHEIEVKLADGTQCEIAATPDGTLLYKECRVDPAKLDAAVTKGIEAALPGGKILEAETKTGPGVDSLTVEVEKDGKEYYLLMTASGEVQGKYLRIPAIVEVPVP